MRLGRQSQPSFTVCVCVIALPAIANVPFTSVCDTHRPVVVSSASPIARRDVSGCAELGIRLCLCAAERTPALSSLEQTNHSPGTEGICVMSWCVVMKSWEGARLHSAGMRTMACEMSAV